MTEHPAEHILEKFALVPEEFSQEERATIEKHISECASCKELWVGFNDLYRTVSENMQSPPSQRDSSLADRLLGKRRRALPLRLLQLPMPGERAIDAFVEVIEPYRRPLAQRFVRYILRYPVRSAAGFSLAAALTALTMFLRRPADTPVIERVQISAEVSQNRRITVQGSGFGEAPMTVPYTGVLPCFSFYDTTAGFEAGYTGNDVLLDYRSWTPTEIVIDGFRGAYGFGKWNAYPGDGILVRVYNPISGKKTEWRGALPKSEQPAFRGMDVSGVVSKYQVSTIQSVQSFSPPFTLQARVVGTVVSDEPFALVIASADGAEGISMSCVLYDGSAYHGVWNQSARGSGLPWSKFENKILASLIVDVEYDLEIAIGADGRANLTVTAGDKTLGSASKQVGLGPFYVLLVQREELPYAIGPNEAVWQSVTVRSDTYSQHSLLQDDFAQDTALSSQLWKVNGPIGKLVGRNLSDPPSKIVTPVLKFKK